MPAESKKQGFAVVSLLAMLLAACAGDFDLGQPRGTGRPVPPFPECNASSYDFVGRGTFAALGLDKATPVPLPDPNRMAMIWVTRDLLPYDRGEPGGPVEMTRMMCFEFLDGGGGSEWPVDAAWQPPGSDAGLGDDGGSAVSLPVSMLAAVAVGAVLTAASLAAFRKKRS
jgi:hypothetical protein